MWRFALRRLAFVPLIAIVIGALTFFLLRILPGDPATGLCGQQGTGERRDEVEKGLGLDRPVHEQYVEWMKDVATGNLGTSLYGGRNVLDEVVRRLPVSFEIMILTLIFSGTLGITFGILSAAMRNTPLDYG